MLFLRYLSFPWCKECDLYHECDLGSECHMSEIELLARCISLRYGITESSLSVNIRGNKEMDNADTELRTGLWGIEHCV